MKILYFNYSDTNLATMIRSFELAKAASQHGHDITLCFINKNFSPPDFFYNLVNCYQSPNLHIDFCWRQVSMQTCMPIVTNKNILHKQYKYKPTLLGILKNMTFSLRYINKELHLIRRYKPDVIVARPDLIISFLFSAAITRLPLVLCTDGPVEELPYYWGVNSKLLNFIDKIRLKRADAILYISKVCGQFLKNKNLSAEKLYFCPNAADPDFFKPMKQEDRHALRNVLNLGDSIVIGFSGNQVSYHGVGDLIKTCLPIMLENPTVKMLIIGDIKDKNSLMLESIPDDILKTRITFTGLVKYTDMPKYIDCADVMVMPYPRLDLFHFSPMKMFENMAMGKLIVAPSIEQIQDILSELSCCFLYEAGSLESMAEAIKAALDAISIGADGASGRQSLTRNHTWHERGMGFSEACRYAIKHH